MGALDLNSDKVEELSWKTLSFFSRGPPLLPLCHNGLLPQVSPTVTGNQSTCNAGVAFGGSRWPCVWSLLALSHHVTPEAWSVKVGRWCWAVLNLAKRSEDPPGNSDTV